MSKKLTAGGGMAEFLIFKDPSEESQIEGRCDKGNCMAHTKTYGRSVFYRKISYHKAFS